MKTCATCLHSKPANELIIAGQRVHSTLLNCTQYKVAHPESILHSPGAACFFTPSRWEAKA